MAGSGRDFQVGPGAGQLASLDLVPWESLTAGDTVRIFYSSTPYRGKMLLAARGTAAKPVLVCGVKGANGERPIIDGRNATTRRGLSFTSASYMNYQEGRSVVLFDRLGTQDWHTARPTHIKLQGLEIRGAVGGATFTNSQGASQTYHSFGGCIWLERGHNITIADNVITDCTNGIYSRSQDLGASEDSTLTKDIRIAGNYIYGHGNVNEETVHNLYVQSVNVTYEFNRIGPMRAGAMGNALKDRSIGAVIRYNHLTDGAHSLDLVEPEDFVETAKASYAAKPTTADTFVYGNIIVKNGETGSVIHYGGDHIGSEAVFRPGKLYFYNNTVYMTAGWSRIFHVSTTVQVAEIWNNVISSASGVDLWLRSNSEIGTAGYTAGGTVNLGKNFVKSTWGIMPSQYHTMGGIINGVSNILSTTANPLDSAFRPLASATNVIDAAVANPTAVAAHPVLFQPGTSFTAANPTFGPIARTVKGAKADLGAIEY